ncbi:unnamed protein product [Peniophora sp. CBMAI 1063]|nr:unnamed protein product [Peniophora sp. CBMAI 1063]
MVPVQLAAFDWNKADADVCVGYLRAIMLHKGDDVGPIIDILNQIDDSGRLPAIHTFPSRDALLKLSWPAIYGLSLFASRRDIYVGRLFLVMRMMYNRAFRQVFAKAMESIWLVYFLHSLRFQAVGRHLFFDTSTTSYRPEDLRLGRHIAEELGPVDLVVSRMYAIWMEERGYPGMGHGMDNDWVINISNLCFRITSTLRYRHMESGQERVEFFRQVRNHSLAGDKRLAFILAAIHWKTSSDLQNKIDTLNVAFEVTPPLAGACVQSLFIVSLFGHSTISHGRYEALPIPVRVAIRPPTDIWPELQKVCVWCGELSSKVCGACQRIRYCSRDCQTAHWRESHKPACSTYKYLPRALPMPENAA